MNHTLTYSPSIHQSSINFFYSSTYQSSIDLITYLWIFNWLIDSSIHQSFINLLIHLSPINSSIIYPSITFMMIHSSINRSSINLLIHLSINHLIIYAFIYLSINHLLIYSFIYLSINYSFICYVSEFPTSDYNIGDGPWRVSQTTMDFVPSVSSITRVHFCQKAARPFAFNFIQLDLRPIQTVGLFLFEIEHSLV